MHRLRIFGSTILLFLLVPALIVAQGEFIRGKESMVGVQVSGYVGSDKVSGGSGSFGYSSRGVFDLAVGGGSMTVRGHNKGYAAFGATLWPLKQGRNHKDLSLGFFGQVSVASAFKAYTAGAVLPLQHKAGKSTLLVTSFGAGFTSVDVDSYWGNSSFVYGLVDLSVVFPTGPTSKMAFSVNLTADDEKNNTVGASLTLLFGKSESKGDDF